MVHAPILGSDIDRQVFGIVSSYEIHVAFELKDQETYSVRKQICSIHLSIDILYFLHK